MTKTGNKEDHAFVQEQKMSGRNALGYLKQEYLKKVRQATYSF